MLGAICKQEYGKRMVLLAFGLITVMVVMSLFSSAALACDVTGVEIYAGRSSTEAHEQVYDGKTLYIAPGETVYFCGVVGHNPSDDDLIWRWDFKDGTVVQYSTDDDDYHEHISHTYSTPIEPGTYKPELKVWWSGSPDQGDSDECTIEVVEVKLYRDSDYTKVLDDWPPSGGNPRSPSWLFAKENPIYVQVKQLGTDPDVAETISVAVWVVSELDPTGGVYLDLKETGANTQIFRNSLAVGELLYLDDSSSSTGSGDYIKVIDEEVLTFKLRCPLVGSISSYEDSTDVMVDRAEVGVEWQRQYSTYDFEIDLPEADDSSEGFYDNIGTATRVWFKNFKNGDLASEKSHWEKSGDSDYADSVDFAWWYGHTAAVLMEFFVDKVPGTKEPLDILLANFIDWGDQDMEWVVVNACSFLNADDSILKVMADGVHLICSYKTDSLDENDGQYFADLCDSSYTIKNAWFKTCDEYQRSGTIARVFGADYCAAESIMSPATGPVFVTRDPTASSGYTHWDFLVE